MSILRKPLLIVLLFLLTVTAYADGVLQIISEDPSLEWDLRVDQQPVPFVQGMTVWLPVGIHRLQAYIEGYQRIDQPVKIVQGEQVEVVLALTEASTLYSPQVQKVSASPRSGILLVTGKSKDVVFSIDSRPDIAPKAMTITYGDHTIRSGSFSWDITVKEGDATVLQLDTDTGKLKEFTVSVALYDALIAESGSLDELFTKGFRSYGKREFWDLRNTLIVLALFLLFILSCLWRFSLSGRVQLAIWKKSSGARRVKSLTKKDPKGKMAGTAKTLQRRIESLDQLDVILIKRIDADKERFKKLTSDSSQKGAKKMSKTKKSLRKMIKIRKRIASMKG